MNKSLRLSASQVAMYLRCPRQWSFRYIEQLKLPPSAAMKLSGVGHEVIEYGYKEKALGHPDVPLDEVADRYADAWKLGLEREEVIFSKDETPDAVRDQGIAAVKEHRLEIFPRVTPADVGSVEQWFDEPLLAKGANPDDAVRYSIIGKIDLTDSNGIIRDNKIVGANRQLSEMDVAKSPQLSIYSIAKRIKTKKPEEGVALDVVRLMKRGPKAVTIPGQRTREFLLDELNTIGHVARGIQAEVFPRNTDGWWCSARWCGYWHLCVGKNLKMVDLGANLEQQLKDSLTEASDVQPG